jgi:hypothetical protein
LLVACVLCIYNPPNAEVWDRNEATAIAKAKAKLVEEHMNEEHGD